MMNKDDYIKGHFYIVCHGQTAGKLRFSDVDLSFFSLCSVTSFVKVKYNREDGTQGYLFRAKFHLSPCINFTFYGY